jgi:hypothetical protein
MTRNALKGVCLLLSLTGLLALTVPGKAHAARFNGRYLLELCDINEDGTEKVKGGHAACQAYISGVLDYHVMLQSFGIAPKLDVCVPENVTLNELHAAVLKYLRENKQHDGFTAAPAVTMALYQVYPCRKGGKKKR